MNQSARNLRPEWIEERQARFYSNHPAAKDWDDLHAWIARTVGQAINACIPLDQAITYLQDQVSTRQGKTSNDDACRDIEHTARNLYAKDQGHTVQYQGRTSYQAVGKPTPQDEAAIIKANIAKVSIPATESDLFNLSPYPIPPGLHTHTGLFFRTLFKPSDYIFTANTETIAKADQPRHIKTAAKWAEKAPRLDEWNKADKTHQFVCISPLTSKPNANGSYRAGDCRASVPYMLVEIDNQPLDVQCGLWMGCISRKVPIVALIYSGNKSYHAWIATSGKTIEERDTHIRFLYGNVFDAFGVDTNKKGKATLARVPGSYRRNERGEIEKKVNGNGKASRLVYLNPGLVS